MRVLVATDLSQAADEAVRQAAALAGTSGALAAVHVLPSLQAVAMLFPQQHAKDALDVGQILARATDAVRERVTRVGKHDAEIFVDQGSDYAEIVQRAEAWKADIVVVGSHGRSGLSQVFGSVADRVVRLAHCHVLVAREVAARGCVLAATDLSEPSLPAVTAAAEEARRRGVALQVVHAVDFVDPDVLQLCGIATPETHDLMNLHNPVRERLADMTRKEGITAEIQILTGPAAKAIVGAAEKIGAELIVVGSHGRTGLMRLLLGSVAEKVVRTAPCSVLIVRMGS